MKTFKYEQIETNKRFYEVQANSEEEAFDMLVENKGLYQTSIANIDSGEIDYKGCEEIEEDEGDEEPKDEYNRQPSNLE